MSSPVTRINTSYFALLRFGAVAPECLGWIKRPLLGHVSDEECELPIDPVVTRAAENLTLRTGQPSLNAAFCRLVSL